MKFSISAMAFLLIVVVGSLSFACGAEQSSIHTLKVHSKTDPTSFIFDDGPARDLVSMLGALKEGNLLKRGDVVKIVFSGMEKSNLVFYSGYSQTGLIHMLISAGAKLEYYDGSGSPINYTVIEWTNYDGSNDSDIDKGKYTWNGAAIDREFIYRRLLEQKSSPGDCIQIVIPWCFRGSEFRALPLNRFMLADIAKRKEMRIEMLYNGVD